MNESFRLFASRHIGPSKTDQEAMLELLSCNSIDELIKETIPESILFSREKNPLADIPALDETEALARIRSYAEKNKLGNWLIGQGYYRTRTPLVLQRNILENPGWYTQYTPYQPEISQGRLEALFHFQSMCASLTGLPIANASLLDEPTAAAEAMGIAYSHHRQKRKIAWIDENCHPQTIAVLQTRASGLGIELCFGSLSSPESLDKIAADCCIAILQYPGSNGQLLDPTSFVSLCKKNGVLTAAACDLLALCSLKEPGEMHIDIAFGNSQRFGVPLGFGGPHAAFFCTSEALKRRVPGRIVGLSKDSKGRPAYRLALQTREQHIRREKATSNICTAQALLANVAATYAMYHGPGGLRRIASRVHGFTCKLANALSESGYKVEFKNFFDTLCVNFASVQQADAFISRAKNGSFYFRKLGIQKVCISLDECTTREELEHLLQSLEVKAKLASDYTDTIPNSLKRSSQILPFAAFHAHQTETKMMRYLKTLENKDLSLTHSMIPLGSCTMKLNSAAELSPISWPAWNSLHPFAPAECTQGYKVLMQELGGWLAQITGLYQTSLQPNSGAQGEYAGLTTISRYHTAKGQGNRNVCLIPTSAHGTNPASAVMAGMKVVAVECDKHGNLSLESLQAKAEEHKDTLAALMVTYPSTHGVFEPEIKEICQTIHSYGGLVYMDGANMNAQVGLCRPGDYGVDVCHLNLHKTFCIPHGGGGPGVGPICFTKELSEFAPAANNYSVLNSNKANGEYLMTGCAQGSASILPISWMYIQMMGGDDLRRASEVAILNANYIAGKLESHYPILYQGVSGRVAHECILDLREIQKKTGVTVEDVAKRLMDFGFHAPTMAWPVVGTLMVEPTESEDKNELDRFITAMIMIRQEIADLENGKLSIEETPLRNAPHTIDGLMQEEWGKKYNRQQAFFPMQKNNEDIHGQTPKFWPVVNRVDHAHGDRNLVCACPPMSEYM